MQSLMAYILRPSTKFCEVEVRRCTRYARAYSATAPRESNRLYQYSNFSKDNDGKISAGYSILQPIGLRCHLPSWTKLVDEDKLRQTLT